MDVELDGRYAFSLAFDIASELRRGQALSEAEIGDLHRRDIVYGAVERAIRLLTYRPRSRAEVSRHLIEKGFDPDVAEATCNHLERLDYLDDSKFASWWVDNRMEHRPRGCFALRSELRARGVAAEHIAAAVENVDEFPGAIRLAAKIADRHRHLSRAEFEKVVGAHLQRRGFTRESILRAVEHAFAS